MPVVTKQTLAAVYCGFFARADMGDVLVAGSNRFFTIVLDN